MFPHTIFEFLSIKNQDNSFKVLLRQNQVINAPLAVVRKIPAQMPFKPQSSISVKTQKKMTGATMSLQILSIMPNIGFLRPCRTEVPRKMVVYAVSNTASTRSKIGPFSMISTLSVNNFSKNSGKQKRRMPPKAVSSNEQLKQVLQV